MSFFLYLLAVLASVALCIVAFLIISAGDLAKFKNLHRTKAKCSILPLITKYGDLITSPQELDFHLTGLKARLREKYQEFESIKSKVHKSVDNLQKFDNYKKGCYEMQANLVQVEEECHSLQQKIEYYKKVQIRLQDDLSPGMGFMGDADWMAGTSRTIL
ncbi:hypothetical protein TcasGA2_TC006155 [Tribolium castaneum]|uniref:Uncharacterized protein n=1 Tax=Tribolium castaneum TaxID=7070 RepID=D6WUX4_TRICA|nr:hypothetical protein TcasGA2_TC006155 [Tribolium castaneum]